MNKVLNRIAFGGAITKAIDLDNVFIAPLISDNGGNVKPVYGAVIPLRDAVTASINPNSSVDVDYADNGAFFVANNRANIEMSLELTNIDPAIIALMPGQKRIRRLRRRSYRCP